MAIWQNKLGRWVVSWYPNGRKGKEKRKTMPAFYTREMAQAFHDSMTEGRDLDKGPTGRVFKDYERGYLAWLKTHRALNTHRCVENSFKNHVMEHLGGIEVDELGPQHITRYKEIRKIEKATNNTVNREVAYFRGFCKYLSRELGAMQPLAFATEALPYERPKPKVLTDKEAEAIIMAADTEYRAFFLLLYGAGLRRDEARTLRVEDVVLGKRGSIKVRRKGGKSQMLPLEGWPLEALRDAIGDRTEGWVFESKTRRGEHIYDARKALKRAKDRAGIPEGRRVNNHLFRHSIATRMLREGVHMRVIQDFLGHSTAAMTAWYAQVEPQTLRENVLKISTPKKRQKRLINKEIEGEK